MDGVARSAHYLSLFVERLWVSVCVWPYGQIIFVQNLSMLSQWLLKWWQGLLSDSVRLLKLCFVITRFWVIIRGSYRSERLANFLKETFAVSLIFLTKSRVILCLNLLIFQSMQSLRLILTHLHLWKRARLMIFVNLKSIHEVSPLGLVNLVIWGKTTLEQAMTFHHN